MATKAKAEKSAPKFHMVLTHWHPHLDDIAAYWMLVRFRPDLCVKDPLLECLRTKKTGKAAQEELAALLKSDPGILAVGIGGDAGIDEHPREGVPAKENECAATLAAKKFGLDDKPELVRILRYIIGQDQWARGSYADLASMVRGANVLFNNPTLVAEWAMLGLDVLYNDACNFFQAAGEIATKAILGSISLSQSRQIQVACIESDNPSTHVAARRARIALLVQRQSSGNIQIHTDMKAGLPPLDDAVRILRVLEQRAKGEVITTDWQTLGQLGDVPGAEEWYFSNPGQILNGSLTTPNTPTRVSLKDVMRAVKVGLNPDMFPNDFAPNCSRGQCTSTPHNECPWYHFGLTRCRKMRFDARQQTDGK